MVITDPSNLNTKQFFDEFNNLKGEFEIILYYKLSNDEWAEEKRFESGRNHFNIDGQIYYQIDKSLISLNMDFDSKSCGACYQIGKSIQKDKRNITGNEILLTLKSSNGNNYLHRQNYSDSTCFYTIQNISGHWKLNHGSRDLETLINQLEFEYNIDKESLENPIYTDNARLYSMLEEMLIDQRKLIDNIKCL